MDLLFQLNSFTVFLAIAAVGFFLSDDVAVLWRHLLGTDSGLDHDLDHGGPGVLQHARVISVFITAFGASGAIASDYGSVRAASGIGALSGVVLATPIYLFARFLTVSSDVREPRAGSRRPDRPRRDCHSRRRRRTGAVQSRRGAGRQDRQGTRARRDCRKHVGRRRRSVGETVVVRRR